MVIVSVALAFAVLLVGMVSCSTSPQLLLATCHIPPIPRSLGFFLGDVAPRGGFFVSSSSLGDGTWRSLTSPPLLFSPPTRKGDIPIRSE